MTLSYINCITKRDTLKNPPNYKDKYVITNPPYLARNKSKDKQIFDKYDVNDLFKCFIKELITNVCLGGIIIIPLNFWSSIRQIELVEKFNKFLDERRKKYNSLFLTNYRESKDIARKRISFDLVYLIVGYLLEN
jgi:hypothetical protein